MPSADYLIRILDGRIEAQGTPDELRSAGELDGLIALEEAEIVKGEPVTTEAEVEDEVEAVDGEPKKEKKKGPGKKLIQGERPTHFEADSKMRNDLLVTSNGKHTSFTSKLPLTSLGS